MEKALEMRFCRSVMVAIQCVLWIRGGHFHFIPKGAQSDPADLMHACWKKAIVPVWPNFAFFSKIEATPIQKTKCGEWMVERSVLFFYRDEIVAVVTLVGGGCGKDALWAESKVRYALYASRAVPKNHPDAGRWVELELAFPAFVENA